MKQLTWMETLFPSYKNDLSAGVRQNLYATFVEADQFMLKLLLFHWVAASTITAFFYSTYLLGFIGGGIIYGIAYASYKSSPGSAWSRATMGAAFMAFSMIFIQQNLGKIEMHFHIFVAIAFLIRYKDILPLIAAGTTIAVHHAVFNAAQMYEFTIAGTPLMVFDYGCGWGIVALHAVFVIIEVVAFSNIILNLTNEYLNNAEVFDIMDDLDDSVNYTSQAADFISDSGQRLAMDAHANSEAVTESNQSINMMNQKIADMNDKTASVKGKMETISSNTADMNSSMVELKDSSNKISSITNLIDSIASQTNLLALNAAVEAARAGEAGAGFAVVTEEVRVLAQKTADAANQIRDMITDNLEKAEQGVGISEKINQQIEELMDWIENVHQSSGEQVAYLDELKLTIQNIANTTENTSEMAENNASTAEELQSQIHVLKTAIRDINAKVQKNIGSLDGMALANNVSATQSHNYSTPRRNNGVSKSQQSARRSGKRSEREEMELLDF
ncbi:methyl-accepting chemotaxis protein [Gracilimonas mengyeensis]|nr:methyl-accepting chemotaxis protein [Gracilimonas mengyeensis]